MHTRFMVIRTFNDMITERLQQRLLEYHENGYLLRSIKQMLHHRHKNTGIGVSRNISIDRQSRYLACPFQAADDTVQMGVHITLYPCYITKKMTHVTRCVTRLDGARGKNHVWRPVFEPKVLSLQVTISANSTNLGDIVMTQR